MNGRSVSSGYIRLAGAFAVCAVFTTAAESAEAKERGPEVSFVNGSFEEIATDGTVPGWTLTTDLSNPESLAVKTAADGSRAIRMTAQGHAVSWKSDAVRVKSGQTYRVGFQLNADGNRHWTYSLEACNVIIETSDGATRHRLENEVRVLRTDGWRQAWLRIEIPSNHNRLRIEFDSKWPAVGRHEGPAAKLARFWYGTGAGVEGNLLIDEVTIETVELDRASRKTGTLLVRTTDQWTGENVPARLRVTNADGKAFVPKDAYRYDLTNTFVPYSDKPFTMALPPGNYTVYGMRGFVLQPVWRDVTVRPGETTDATIAFGGGDAIGSPDGWRGGDHHVHLFFHGHTQHPLMTVRELSHVARAEGLDYVSFQAELAWMQRSIEENPDVRIGDFICETAHEITTDFWGHLNFVNAVMVPDLPAPPALWPANYQIREMVEAGGGVTVYTHPFGRLTDENTAERLADPRAGLIARGLPVDALLGQRCLVDVLSSERSFDIHYKMRTMERLWNLGIRFGVGGSSDAYVDQGAHLPGDFRTFTFPAKNDFSAIADAYRKGRTFATNGPLLTLEVNEAGIGETLELDGPARVNVSSRAHSWWGLNDLEIVHDGEVVARVPREGKNESIQTELDLEITRSGWVYARVWGPDSKNLRNVKVDDEEFQFAMTSPVWLSVRGHPEPILEENVAFFREWLEAVRSSLPGYRNDLAARREFGNEESLRRDEKKAADLIDSALEALSRIASGAQDIER